MIRYLSIIIVFCSRTHSLNRPRGKLSVGIHVIFATSFISLRILYVLDVFLRLVEFFFCQVEDYS